MQCALNTKSFHNIFGEALIALAYDLTIDCNEEKKKKEILMNLALWRFHFAASSSVGVEATGEQ